VVAQDARREVNSQHSVLSRDVRSDVLIEELENERNTVSEDEMLTHVLKLIDVIEFEVFE